jgi:CubicO group peptidase (beta-lactamase class C family)
MLGGGSAIAQTPGPLAADQASATPGGATFTAPKAWSLMPGAGLTQIVAPEDNFRVAIVDVGTAADAKAAVAAAWARYKPGWSRPLKVITPGSARNGWDERQTAAYETSPNEKIAVQAIALRKGTAWTVLLLEGAEATAEKRLGAVGLVAQSLRPAGYAKESFAGRKPNPLTPERIAAIRGWVQASMERLGVPGAGLALIENGRIVYEGGVGVKTLGRAEPVGPNTLFMIASNTKGMSTLLLAKLVDEGRVKWDEPVTQAYPGFRLGSPETTSKVLVRHLVCACTGLPRKDLDWIFNTRRDTPADTTFTQLAATEPTSGFGEVFQYNNLMASAAGYLAGRMYYPKLELGAAYDRAMEEQIFRRLGMTRTTFSMTKALASDHASPHGWSIDARPTLVSDDFNYVVGPYRPAGGAWSSAHDMALYVRNELSGGVLPDGKRLIGEAALKARREHGVPIGEDAWYGMGLESDRYWGVEVVHHGGSMAGYKSDWIAIPEAGVGAVLLTNSEEGQALLRPFMRRVLEVLYDGKPEAEGDVAAAAARLKAAYAAERPRLTVPPDPAVMARVASRYRSAELGELTLTPDGAGWRAANATWASPVATRKNDDGTFSVIMTDPVAQGMEFVLGSEAQRATLTVRDGQHEYRYTPAG